MIHANAERNLTMPNSEYIYQSKPDSMNYQSLIAKIEQGSIKIPQFQRKFVWSIEETAGLLDSILKGYPIGSFIIWKTNERLRSVRNIGKMSFPDTPAGDMVQYVLDGQQRMTSLYVALKGAKIINESGNEVDYSNIYIDLSAKTDEQIVLTDTKGHNEKDIISIVSLLNSGYKVYQQYPDYGEKIDKYRISFQTYQYATIEVENAPIDIATEIFTRINVGGKSLTLFEIMVAKTYDEEKQFDLSEKYDELIDNLSNIGYETISSSTVLQSVSVCLAKDCTKKRILKLKKESFIEKWDDVISAFESAVDYFRSFYRIPVSQILPYDSLLVPFTYYFYNHKDKPVGEQQKLLQDYFWRCIINQRFSSASESKLTQDIERIDKILAEEQLDYEESVDVSPESIKSRGSFSVGSAYIKGLLCILAYQQPKSFIDNSLVTIDNSWLKIATSKNYHHFFPKAYMKKNQPDVPEWLVNHIANITIVDDFLNKRSIRDRAPSKYIGEYQVTNNDLASSLKSHLIGDPETSGINNNDYMTFFNQRLEALSNELKDRLILTNTDKT